MSKYNSITSITREEQDPPILKEPEGIEFRRLKQSFTQWLRLLNFDTSTIRYAPARLQEFLCWLECNQITEITGITRQTITNYFNYLKKRPHHRKGGLLSPNTLRTHLTTLRRFARYLRESEQGSIEVSYAIKGKSTHVKEVFTKEEIKALYEATTDDLLGLRDKAMLAVYYGCGLRRSEGVTLEESEVQLEENLLYVRKGKNSKARYVPLTSSVKEDLRNYMEYSRPVLLKSPARGLFLTNQGKRVTGDFMVYHLTQLKKRAGIHKNASLHTLRHSIATHLLESGMDLEKIKQFLGHSSLESTQIYTRIAYENKLL